MQQLHPRAVWLFFFKSFAVSFFLVFFLGNWIFQIALAVLVKDITLPVSLIIGALVLLVITLGIAWLLAKLSYKYYRYELKEDGFRKESGVIWKRYVTIPYERIQNVDIYRGLLDRILGLSDLHIQTAGFSGYGGRLGGNSEGRLPGLDPQTAERLRDELVRRSKGSKQGL
jgi:uncharacterized protein